MNTRNKPQTRYVPVNVRHVPRVTRDMFKAYCARRGYTMRAALIALMNETATEDKPIKSLQAGSGRY